MSGVPKIVISKLDQIANEKNATNTLKWFMQRWIAVAKEIKMERLSENKVLEKWDEVNLHNPCSEMTDRIKKSFSL